MHEQTVKSFHYLCSYKHSGSEKQIDKGSRRDDTSNGLIEIWHDTEMLGGDRWQQEIFSKHLPASDLLLYLVSAGSLASGNCYEELEVALEKKIRVIPIIFSDCDWKGDQQLSDFQVFPDNGTPINEWIPESKGWQNAVKGIRRNC